MQPLEMSTLLHLLKVELFVPLFSPCCSVPLSLNSRLIIHCLCFNGTDGDRELAGSAVVVALGRASGRKLAGGAVIVIAQGGTDGGREFAGSAVVALGRASGRELAGGAVNIIDWLGLLRGWGLLLLRLDLL